MAGTKAAGTAGGSTKHTPTQDDRELLDTFAQLAPEVVDKFLDFMKARHDEEQRAAEAARRIRAVEEGHTTPLTDAQLAALEKLRVPFEPDQIEKLPKPWCKACNASPSRVCGDHKKIKCSTCNTWITEAHNDLDYVGHAGITARLLSVDPTWDWEPLSVDDRGQPYIDERGGMWIKLTVCGMTRKGYGDAVGKKNSTTAVKEIIGDAIRNAAMRFGMALDLWSKVDLHKESEPPAHPAEQFVDAIKEQRVWSSETWLSGVRKEAEEAGQLDYQPPKGGGATLGEIIDNQLAHLAKSAEIEAKLRLEREEQRKAATNQVAAEHGVQAQNTGARLAARQQRPGDEPPITEAEVRNVCTNHWVDPDALEQALARGRRAGVVDVPSQPNDPNGPTLGQAMRTQINNLRRAAARSTGTARAAHAADYNDQHDDYGDAHGQVG